jgi:hypothetical protein
MNIRDCHAACCEQIKARPSVTKASLAKLVLQRETAAEACTLSFVVESCTTPGNDQSKSLGHEVRRRIMTEGQSTQHLHLLRADALSAA